MSNEFRLAFLYVWDHFLQWTPPKFLCPEELPENPPGQSRTMLPVLGAAIGGILTLLTILAGQLSGQLTAAFFAGLACPLLLELATGWTGLYGVLSFLVLRNEGAGFPDALNGDWEAARQNGGLPAVVLCLSIYLVRAFLFGALAYYDRAGCFAAALAGGYFVRAGMTAFPDPETGREYFPEPEKSARYYFISLGLVLLLIGLLCGSLAHMVIFFLLAWGILYVSELRLKDAGGMIRFSRIAFFGYIAETALLLAGLLIRI